MVDEDEDKPHLKLVIRAAVVIAVVLAVVYFAFLQFDGSFDPNTVPAGLSSLLNGKPKAGIRVTYHPQFDVGSRKFTPNGSTTADGKFTLSTAQPFDGAPPGEYIVTFDLPYITNGPIEEEVDLFKGKYKDPLKSTWKVKVEANSQETFQLQLRFSKCCFSGPGSGSCVRWRWCWAVAARADHSPRRGPRLNAGPTSARISARISSNSPSSTRLIPPRPRNRPPADSGSTSPPRSRHGLSAAGSKNSGTRSRFPAVERPLSVTKWTAIWTTRTLSSWPTGRWTKPCLMPNYRRPSRKRGAGVHLSLVATAFLGKV